MLALIQPKRHRLKKGGTREPPRAVTLRALVKAMTSLELRDSRPHHLTDCVLNKTYVPWLCCNTPHSRAIRPRPQVNSAGVGDSTAGPRDGSRMTDSLFAELKGACGLEKPSLVADCPVTLTTSMREGRSQYSGQRWGSENGPSEPVW